MKKSARLSMYCLIGSLGLMILMTEVKSQEVSMIFIGEPEEREIASSVITKYSEVKYKIRFGKKSECDLTEIQKTGYTIVLVAPGKQCNGTGSEAVVTYFEEGKPPAGYSIRIHKFPDPTDQQLDLFEKEYKESAVSLPLRKDINDFTRLFQVHEATRILLKALDGIEKLPTLSREELRTQLGQRFSRFRTVRADYAGLRETPTRDILKVLRRGELVIIGDSTEKDVYREATPFTSLKKETSGWIHELLLNNK